MRFQCFEKIAARIYSIVSSKDSDTTEAHKTEFAEEGLTNRAIRIAALIRVVDRQPAIIIHGVTQRSGTVYEGELLRLHPDVFAYPNDMWETPFLELAGDIHKIQQRFFQASKNKILAGLEKVSFYLYLVPHS